MYPLKLRDYVNEKQRDAPNGVWMNCLLWIPTVNLILPHDPLNRTPILTGLSHDNVRTIFLFSQRSHQNCVTYSYSFTVNEVKFLSHSSRGWLNDFLLTQLRSQTETGNHYNLFNELAQVGRRSRHFYPHHSRGRSISILIYSTTYFLRRRSKTVGCGP